MSRIRVLNTEVDNLTMAEAVATVRTITLKNRHGGGSSYVVTPNLDHLVNLDEDAALRAAYEDAELILPDGASILWLARLQGTPLKEKVSGSDLFPHVCNMAEKEGLSLFLLGAAPGVADMAAENILERNPMLTISGTYSPPYGFEADEEEIRKTIDAVTSAAPDILAIALGDKKGEIFIHQYRTQLCVPISLSIGATLDFESKTKRRAPAWMSKAGLEWLYRTFQEPRRIGSRVLKDIRRLPGLVVKYR